VSALGEIVSRSYRSFARRLARNLAAVDVPAEKAGSVAVVAEMFPVGDLLVRAELMVFRPDVWPGLARFTARQVVGELETFDPQMGALSFQTAGTRAECEFVVAWFREHTKQVVATRPGKLDAPGPEGEPRYAVAVTVLEW